MRGSQGAAQNQPGDREATAEGQKEPETRTETALTRSVSLLGLRKEIVELFTIWVGERRTSGWWFRQFRSNWNLDR